MYLKLSYYKNYGPKRYFYILQPSHFNKKIFPQHIRVFIGTVDLITFLNKSLSIKSVHTFTVSQVAF